MLKDAGFDAELVRFGSSRQEMDALLAGEIQGTGGMGLPIIAAVETRFPGTLKTWLIGVETAEHFSNYVLVRKDSPIKRIEDLRGKSIGTYTGSAPLMYVKLFLHKIGLDPVKDVQIRQVEVPLQVGALEKGLFDALYTIEPEATVAVETGIARVLVENPRVKYIMDPFPAIGNAFTAKFVTEHPDQAARLVRALEKAVEYLEQHPQESLAVLAKYTEMDPKIAAKSRLFKWWKLNKADLKPVQAMFDLLHEQGELSSRVDAAKAYLGAEDLKK